MNNKSLYENVLRWLINAFSLFIKICTIIIILQMTWDILDYILD